MEVTTSGTCSTSGVSISSQNWHTQKIKTTKKALLDQWCHTVPTKMGDLGRVAEVGGPRFAIDERAPDRLVIK